MAHRSAPRDDEPLSLQQSACLALDRQLELLARLRRAERFGVNVLASDQEVLATTFSTKGPDKFASVEWWSDAGLPRVLALPSCWRAAPANF